MILEAVTGLPTGNGSRRRGVPVVECGLRGDASSRVPPADIKS